MAFGKTKASPAEEARERFAGGHTVHVATLDTGMHMSGGAVPELADLIENVECEGWHLGHVYPGPGRTYLVFRRSR